MKRVKKKKKKKCWKKVHNERHARAEEGRDEIEEEKE